jgi:GNAT superfamily N-acetyltransferase
MRLPDGLTARPFNHADAQAVTDLIAAQEIEDCGRVIIDLSDIEGEWARPSYNLADSSIGIFDGDRLVAYGEVAGPGRGDAAVHPEYRGRGIGTAIAQWMQEKAREQGHDVVGMPVPAGSPGERLLTELGYRPRWSSWVLQLPEGTDIEPQPLPQGYEIREGTEDEQETVYHVIEDAFLEFTDREKMTYDDFAAMVFRRPGFESWNIRVAVDPDGEIVGAAYLLIDAQGCGYVDKLAVRNDQRHKGLARALLVDAFATARAHGAHTSELSTDSRTGALGLYEKVGMEVYSNWVNMAIPV